MRSNVVNVCSSARSRLSSEVTSIDAKSSLIGRFPYPFVERPAPGQRRPLVRYGSPGRASSGSSTDQGGGKRRAVNYAASLSALAAKRAGVLVDGRSGAVIVLIKGDALMGAAQT